jgi:tetratricopeptide (TPR) repeat protein
MHLERLGWAFVTKARVSFDPGFYKLAEQCALCIESQKPHSPEALRAADRRDEACAVESQLMQRGAADDPQTFALYLATTGRDTKTVLRLAEEELKVRADVFTLDTLAWALKAAGRNQEALSFSEQALAEGTQDARLFYHAGVIAAMIGQNKEAENWFKKATSIQQMLLPSERDHLSKESAALQSQKSILASSQSN